MQLVLRAAGLYSLLFTAGICLWPEWMFSHLEVAPTQGFWTAYLIGFAAAYGIALIIASVDPIRFWPVVLIGLIMLSTVTAAEIRAWMDGTRPVVAVWYLAVGLALLAGPFFMVLKSAYDQFIGARRVCSPDVQRMALRSKTQHGVSLDELSRLSPILVVFLRHFGCPFCRETLEDLRKQRPAIEQNGTRIVLVHMSETQEAHEILYRYDLQNLDRVSDPNQTVYKAFGLGRGRLGEILGPKEWWHGVRTILFEGHGVGLLREDIFQMPGAFLLFHGQVLNGYRHQTASDRPNYLELASGGGMMFPTR